MKRTNFCLLCNLYSTAAFQADRNSTVFVSCYHIPTALVLHNDIFEIQLKNCVCIFNIGSNSIAVVSRIIKYMYLAAFSMKVCFIKVA